MTRSSLARFSGRHCYNNCYNILPERNNLFSLEFVPKPLRRSPPHGVIADIRLGSSDGYALIKGIRDNDVEYRGFTPAIAVTGFASPEDEKRAMAAGFNAYIPKPFDPADVITTIQKLLAQPVDRVA